AAFVPQHGLHLHAPLDEGAGQALTMTVAGRTQTIRRTAGFAWDTGHVTAKAFKVQPGGLVEVPEAGDFDTEKPFSFGGWVRLPRTSGFTGAVLARMDEGDANRGWELWVESGRIGAHLVHKWPGNAIRVISQRRLTSGQWHHVFVTYDGSG